MRRIRYSVAMSLDGYIAGPNGEADWIIMDPEIDFGAMMSEFDTLLVGRRTFEPMARPGKSGGGFTGMKTYVVSSTLQPKDYPGVTILGDSWREDVAALRAGSGKDIWLFGGGMLFRGLLDAGLVDGVGVAVVPVLLGGGVPLLPTPAARSRLTLLKHRVYPTTGTVVLEYEIKRGRTPGAKMSPARTRKPKSRSK